MRPCWLTNVRTGWGRVQRDAEVVDGCRAGRRRVVLRDNAARCVDDVDVAFGGALGGLVVGLAPA